MTYTQVNAGKQLCSSSVAFGFCLVHECNFSFFFFSIYSTQVLGESLCITTDYLNTKEKVMVATSKAEFVKVECSQLRKDLITTMNKKNAVNQEIKELTKALRVEKALVVQKDDEIQVTLLKTNEERAKVIKKFKGSEELLDLQFIQWV